MELHNASSDVARAIACEHARLRGVPLEAVDAVLAFDDPAFALDERGWESVLDAMARGFLWGWSAAHAA